MQVNNFTREEVFTEYAYDLQTWFQSIQKLSRDTIFAISRGKEYHDATILGVITENARKVCESKEDGFNLYTPVCLLLVSLSERMNITVVAKHWKAAIENVFSLTRELKQSALANETGIFLGTSTSIFKSQMREALQNAGLLGYPTNLTEENRKSATCLALNWGIRYLIAYAFEELVKSKLQKTKAQDLFWIGNKMKLSLERAGIFNNMIEPYR